MKKIMVMVLMLVMFCWSYANAGSLCYGPYGAVKYSQSGVCDKWWKPVPSQESEPQIPIHEKSAVYTIYRYCFTDDVLPSWANCPSDEDLSQNIPVTFEDDGGIYDLVFKNNGTPYFTITWMQDSTSGPSCYWTGYECVYGTVRSGAVGGEFYYKLRCSKVLIRNFSPALGGAPVLNVPMCP